jgi:hypothetical protein
VSVTMSIDELYLQGRDARKHWELLPCYAPQVTDSACSLAAITMLLNMLRRPLTHSVRSLVTQASLLKSICCQDWAAKTAQGGRGVTFEELHTYLSLSLKAYRTCADITVYKPSDSSPSTIERLRHLLSEVQCSDCCYVLAYFNQGIVTGDWDGPHVSPLGTYDAQQRRVLIWDVDPRFYPPYWASDESFLRAMLCPAPEEQGPLVGETGGLIRVMVQQGEHKWASIRGNTTESKKGFLTEQRRVEFVQRYGGH